MEITLEKVDIVRERTKVSYAEAKDALEKSEGSVVDAIIYIEKNQKNFSDNITDMGNEFVSSIKDIVKKGNVNRIKIMKEDKMLLDIPVTAGVVGGAIGIVYLPALLAIGALAAVVSKIQIVIERPDGKIEIVNNIMNTTESTDQNVQDNMNNINSNGV